MLPTGPVGRVGQWSTFVAKNHGHSAGLSPRFHGVPTLQFFSDRNQGAKIAPKSWSMPRKPSLFRGTREACFFSSQLPGVDVKKRWLVGGLSTHLGMEQIPPIKIVMTGGWFMIVLPTLSRFIAGWWFGTFFIFPDFSIYWECHHPNWRTPSFLRGVGQPPTRWCRIGVFHVFFSAPTLSAFWRPRSKTPRASCFRGNLMPSNW